ncbi:MAG: hypothetical protein LWY06_13010 [Firmicutes bacterium]|nr:hypothetical protein [Bacillota bacterium]
MENHNNTAVFSERLSMQNAYRLKSFFDSDRLVFRIIVIIVLLFFFKCLYFCGHTHCDFSNPTECCGQKYLSAADNLEQIISGISLFIELIPVAYIISDELKPALSFVFQKPVFRSSDYIPITSYPLRGSPLSSVRMNLC